MSRPARAPVRPGVVPAQTGRFVELVVEQVLRGAAPLALGPEDRHSDDGDDPDKDSDDKEGAHDGDHRVVHGYTQPRGR